MDNDNQVAKVKRLTPKPETLKRLFALSGNQCAFPDCSNNLFTSSYIFIGEVAHIEAAMPDGERFNPTQTNEQRRSFNNLIALCRIHHAETNEVLTFPKEALFQMKDDHEQRFLKNDSTFDVPEAAISEVFSLLETLSEGVMEIKENVFEIKLSTDNTNETVNKIYAIVSAQQGQLNSLENEYNRQLQEIIKDIENGLVQRSLVRLLNLKSNIWDNIEDTLKYNILAQTGVCYYELENYQKTAEVMIEAYNLRPETAPALANLVNALMAIDDYEKARFYQDIFKEKFPDSTVALGLEIKMRSTSTTFNELLLDIPKEKREDPEILLSLSMAAFRQSDHVLSFEYLSRLYALDPSQEIYQKMLLQTVLELLSADFALTNLQIISEENQRRLEFAGELVDKLLASVMDSELIQVKGKLFMAKGYILGMLKQYAEATSYIDKSIEINPENCHAIKLSGMLYSRQGNWGSAIAAWLKITDYMEFPDLPAMIAEGYAKKGEAEKGIPILEAFLENAPESYFKTQSVHALLDFYIHENMRKKVISYTASNFADKNIPSLISLARVSNFLGHPEEAELHAREAFQLVNSQTTYKEILFLAEELIACRSFFEAATLYERIAVKSKESQPTIKLYRLYHTIGETGKALAVLEELRAVNGPLRNPTSLEIRIYQQLGNYPKVIDLGEQYLSVYGDDQEMRLIIAGNYLRENVSKRPKELLDYEFDFQDLPLNSQYTLLTQLDSLGQRSRVYKIAYDYLRFGDSVSSNDLFISVFLKYPLEQETSYPEVIGLDTCVLLENELHVQYTLIVEDRDIQNLQPEEVGPSDPRFSVLLGKAVGDNVTFDNFRTWQIKNIRRKYDHAFIECKRKIDTVFSEKSQYQTFSFQDLNSPLKHAGTNNVFSSFQNGMTACQNHQFSFAGLAAAFDKNPIELWQIFKAASAEFLSTTGSFDETSIGFKEQIKSKKLCADITALMFMSELGLSTEILGVFGKILITHSTYDLIFDYVEQVKSLTGKGKGDDKLENLLVFVSQVTERRFPDSLIGINGLELEESEATFGKSFFHTRLLCESDELILLSDDYFFRKDVVDKDGTCATWTQDTLAYLLSQGIISPEIYEQKSICLLDLRYTHTSVNHNILFRALIGYDGMPKNTYQRCISILNGGKSDLPSAIGVAYFFILKVQAEDVFNEKAMDQFIYNTFMEVSNNRQLREVITGFKTILKERTSANHLLELPMGMKIMKQIKKISDTYFDK